VQSRPVTISELAACCELVLVAVPDDAIGVVAEQLTGQDLTGRAFVHTSGAKSVDVFAELGRYGAMVGSLHPAYPFPAQPDGRHLEGVVFATESNHPVLGEWLSGMIVSLGGREIKIPAGEKPKYHAALVFASNYVVTLYALAETMLMEIGASRSDADAALQALLSGTVTNIETLGIPAALTGPLVRGDAGTILAHLQAIESPQIREIYRRLAHLSFPMLVQRGVDLTAIEASLQDGL
jgi:predicted short-subunit dehydrogenase-like oxidoreductase (DUF2520 family)